MVTIVEARTNDSDIDLVCSALQTQGSVSKEVCLEERAIQRWL